MLLSSFPVFNIGGSFIPPGDKSISHRALMIASLAKGTSTLTHFLPSEDCLHTLEALKACGVLIERQNTTVRVQGVGLQGLQAPNKPLYLGNSGTGLRLLTGLLSAQPFKSVLTGDESLSRRPMARILDPLALMGAHIEATEGDHVPLVIYPATLNPLNYALPVASAQVKSALLLAGLASGQPVHLSGLTTTRDHTERLFKHWSVSEPGYKGKNLTIPGDISSAAFFIALVAGWEGMSLRVKSVGLNTYRTGLLSVLKSMGANIEWQITQELPEPVGTIIVQGARLQGVSVPAHKVPDFIDEFPALCAAAAMAEGQTLIQGARELRFKESDRLHFMYTGLTQLGIVCELFEEGMLIKGGSPTGGRIDSGGDHRIAMAFLTLGARAGGPIEVEDCSTIATSFPNFVETAQQLGLNIVAVPAKESFMNPIPVITIDGPSGSGKGTLSQRLAMRLHWHLLDSGAIYRILAYAAHQKGVAFNDVGGLVALAEHLNVVFEPPLEVGQLVRVIWEGQDVSTAIRTEECGGWASQSSGYPEVRAALLQRQRDFRKLPGLVTDGRDMGTVVFPDAPLKLFLDASPQVRAERRLTQLKNLGKSANLRELFDEIVARDERDRNRSASPLKPASDAIIFDTSHTSQDEVLAWAWEYVIKKGLFSKSTS